MASCSDDCSVKVWSCATAANGRDPNWTPLCALPAHHRRTVYSCHFSAAGLIATGSGDNAIRVFQEESGKGADGKGCAFREVACVESAHASDVNCVRWAPATNDAAVAGQLLASAGDDGLVKIWRLLEN